MSSGHRPTFNPAVAGKSTYGGFKSTSFSAKDTVAHTKLKFRANGQSTEEEMVHRDLKSELAVKEQKYIENKGAIVSSLPQDSIERPKLLLKYQAEVNLEEIKAKYDDADADVGNSDEDLETSSDDDDDEDDDELELQKELERIKEERAALQAKKEQEEAEILEKMKKESAVKGNPLLDLDPGSAKVKRRWNDDVVFRNQARDEPDHKKRFINDTIRNDFHRSFLKKYVK